MLILSRKSLCAIMFLSLVGNAQAQPRSGMPLPGFTDIPRGGAGSADMPLDDALGAVYARDEGGPAFPREESLVPDTFPEVHVTKGRSEFEAMVKRARFSFEVQRPFYDAQETLRIRQKEVDALKLRITTLEVMQQEVHQRLKESSEHIANFKIREEWEVSAFQVLVRNRAKIQQEWNKIEIAIQKAVQDLAQRRAERNEAHQSMMLLKEKVERFLAYETFAAELTRALENLIDQRAEERGVRSA